MQLVTISRTRILAISFGLIGLAIGVTPVRGDAIYLKDGSTFYGKVKREMELLPDPASGQMIPIVKSTSCFLLDDLVRYVVFGHKQVANVDPELEVRAGYIGFVWSLTGGQRIKLPPKAVVGEPTPFNDKWEREVPITIEGLNTRIKQKLTFITPYAARVESQRYDWTVNYLTAEWGPDVVLSLLRSHPDMRTDPPDFEKQYKIFRFCTQAGWLNAANEELKRLRAQFPTEKEKLDAAQDLYRQLMLQRSWDDVAYAVKAGRHWRAEDLMRQLPLTDLPPVIQAESANLRSKYETLKQKLDATRAMIAYCSQTTSKSLADATLAILHELNYDTVDRPENFTILARQAEQAERNGQAPKHTREQLLAVLVSGWVFGPTANETSPEIATRAWALRDRLMEYQRANFPAERKRLLTEIETQSMFSLPQIAQAIGLLPPAESSEFDQRQPGLNGMDRKTKIAWAASGPYEYTVRLPAEYHPHRAYPLLLVLPTAGQSTKDAMAPWEAQALRNGYILASVDWGTIKNRYEYSPQEHAAALDCIRDLKRFLQVDPDRVFLTGYGDGAHMAIDVGMSHPDIFAGVIPINGRPRWYASSWYWKNTQQLPFYLVCGELTDDVRTWDANLYEKFADRGYPSVMVVYRGRVNQFYPAEIPNIFDWMERKRRAIGFPELGRNPVSGHQGEEYQSFRETDHRFFWLSVDKFDPRFMLEDFVKKPNGDKVSAAIQANIRDNNEIKINTRGVKKLSVWLGRMRDPAAGTREMVDFSKPVKVTINSTAWNNQNKLLTPKLEYMLEDFYSRCDRNRLFMVRLDFDVK